MLNKIILLVITTVAVHNVFADTVTVRPDHPDQYVVVKGDTLWDISARFLNEPWYWPEIWEGNPQIENPHLIYPGDVISLSYKDGQPVLTVNGDAANGGAGDGGASERSQTISGRNVKLSPQIRAYDRDLAIPTIPIDAIRPFLEHPQVVSGDEIDSWPYVVANIEQSLVATAGNKVYVRGLPENVADRNFSIYRKGKALINSRKDDKRILGYEAIYIGDAVLEERGDPASVIVTTVEREIVAGDRLSRQFEKDIETRFIPHLPSEGVAGNILSVYGGDVVNIGKYMIIAFDIGAKDGLESGNVLGIFQAGRVALDKTAPVLQQAREDNERLRIRQEYRDAEDDSLGDALGGALAEVVDGVVDAKRRFDKKFPHISNRQAGVEEVGLPEEQAGVVIVFKTFDRLSYGLIMESTRSIRLLDSVRNL